MFLFVSCTRNLLFLNLGTCIRYRTNYQLRNNLWNDLNKAKLELHDEWMAAGDFNSVTNIEEVNNPNTFNQRRCKGLKDWMFNEGLIELGFSGPKYTWVRGNNEDTFKGARLDRGVYSTEFLDMSPNIKLLKSSTSDA